MPHAVATRYASRDGGDAGGENAVLIKSAVIDLACCIRAVKGPSVHECKSWVDDKITGMSPRKVYFTAPSSRKTARQ